MKQENLTIEEIIKQENLTEAKQYPIRKYDKNNNEIYFENSDGYWTKRKYDKNNNEIYFEDNSGYWWKSKYDKNNNEIYFEDSKGCREKKKYDKNNNLIYYETSNGYWRKKDGENTLEFKDGKYFLNEKLMKKLIN